MMKSRPSLRNSVRAGLSISFASLLILGCSSALTPTYLKENIDEAIQDICKKEYNFEVKSRLVGSTLWIYLPIENLFEKAKKPEKYTEKFSIEQNQQELYQGTLKLQYSIRPLETERVRFQEYVYNKDSTRKINDVWKVLRRVLFSMDRSKAQEPQFFCLVTSDIKNGYELRETFYLLDLKKVSYEFISWTEYQHRIIQESNITPAIIDDREGLHISYRDITMREFVTKQIEQRIRLKFQKPEVEKTADIDAEIMKVAIKTLQIYGFRDFERLELENSLSGKMLILTNDEVWAHSPLM